MCKFTSFYFDITYLDLMHYRNAHNYAYKNTKNRGLEILIFQLKGHFNLKKSNFLLHIHVLIFIYTRVNL